MTPEQLQGRLSEVRLSQLGEAWVDHLLAQPLGALLPEEELRPFALQALQGWLGSDTALPALEKEARALGELLRQTPRPLDEVLPAPILGALEQLAEKAPSPEGAAVLAVLDRPPVRRLIRRLLLDALLDFGRALRSPVEGVTRSLSGLAKFAAERTGTLGSLMGALGSEVEKQFERRASEFADAALSGFLQKLVEELSHPQRAKEQAELRVALLEGLLTLKGPQWARSLEQADLPGSVQLLRHALASWLESEAGQAQWSDWAVALILRHRELTARALLEEVGLYLPVRAQLCQLVLPQARSFVSTPAFARWLAELLAEEQKCA